MDTVRQITFPGLGLELQVDRVAFRLGEIPVYWYGIIIAAGFLLAVLYILKRAKEFGVDGDRLLDVILGGAIGGIIGARLYYVAFQWDYYSQNLAAIFDTRSGGMAIYGGVLFGFLTGYLMCRWRRVKFLPAADLTALGFLIGQGIGRWGNFVNVEAFGSNTSLPWGMSGESITAYLLQNEAQLEQLGMNIDPYMPVHPTFLYESLWCLLGFVLLSLYVRRRKFDGELLLLYVIWYGSERMLVEGLRTDSLLIPGTGLRVSQVLAAVLVLCALALWIAIRVQLRRNPGLAQLYVNSQEARQLREETEENRQEDPPLPVRQEQGEGGEPEMDSQPTGEEPCQAEESVPEDQSLADTQEESSK